MRIYKNLDTLKKAIAKKERALKEERERQTLVCVRQGFGAGMRRNNINFSHTREDKLNIQLRELYIQEQGLEEQNEKTKTN